ncbi:unnamed protein product [Urochloa decumbens]|uniref:GPI-anchored protein LLG1-like domain-containing protein n=1 Tax=Urochloa decumbens TaxID=240449 RepID=A0ABC9C8I6_9POAL
MGSTSTTKVVFFCVAFSMVAVGSAAQENNLKFISMGALECSNVTETETPGRKLFEAECPVKFQNNRGVNAVARSCRGVPSEKQCCGALKAFACPYSDLLNENAVNGCANDMFFEINVRGRLRPGLFSQMCVEGPYGLQCT